jgi:hypothetical protein
MASQYDEAVAALYQAPHGEFVNERKRLAAELKAAGDKAGATKLGKLARPPTSAWTVNQLWWQARDAFDALFESAEKLRGGDLSASGEHRDAIAKLRQHAQKILTEAGHGATESTLRRVTTTLAALAASGGFGPDPEGALAADRDPPGFEAVGISAPELVERHTKKETPAPKPAAKSPKSAAPANDNDDDDAPSRKEAAEAKRRAEAEEKRQLAEAAAERRKKEQARAKRLSELRSVETELGGARSEVERKQKELDRLQKAVDQAQATVEKSQAIVDELEAKLAELVRANEESTEEETDE